MLVAQSPDLLLVDEPVAGLTDEETYNIGELLLALAESHSILVIEHDMSMVMKISDRFGRGDFVLLGFGMFQLLYWAP